MINIHIDLFYGLGMKNRLRCLVLLIVLSPVGIPAALSVLLWAIIISPINDNKFMKFGTWYADLLEEIGL